LTELWSNVHCYVIWITAKMYVLIFPGKRTQKSGDVINFTTVECRISSWLKWYKKDKNWLRLAKVIVKNNMSRTHVFMVYCVYIISIAFLIFVCIAFCTFYFVFYNLLILLHFSIACMFNWCYFYCQFTDLITTDTRNMFWSTSKI